MAMTYNSKGYLILEIARGKYRLYSFLLLIAAYYFHAISPIPKGEDFTIVAIICILCAITLDLLPNNAKISKNLLQLQTSQKNDA